MKKSGVKKLTLNKETVRALNPGTLEQALGGIKADSGSGCTACFSCTVA